jgi:hypothetical protein
MFSMSIESNIKAFTRGLNSVQRRQVPFATARALTWTAQEVQKAIQGEVPRVFNVTRKWWLKQQPTGIKIKPATKAVPVALIYTDAYFAALQEDGGIKYPHKGAGLLVPSARVPKYGRKSGGAAKVLAGKKILRRGGKAGGDPIVTLPSGKRGIFRRRGKKRLPIELLYSFVDTAAIHPRLHFKALAAGVVNRSFASQFHKSLARALKGAL